MSPTIGEVPQAEGCFWSTLGSHFQLTLGELIKIKLQRQLWVVSDKFDAAHSRGLLRWGDQGQNQNELALMPQIKAGTYSKTFRLTSSSS